MPEAVTIRPANTKADRKAFVALPFRLYKDDPNWIPPLKDEAYGVITPGKNPFFEHAEVQLYLAERDGVVVGRISAHIDRLWQGMPVEKGGGADSGNWGFLDAESQEIADRLIATAEDWLRARGVKRVLAPVSLSIWEEPGLLIKGHDHPPLVMMGHDDPRYEAWVEGAGYAKVKDLHTWDLDVRVPYNAMLQRVIAAGHKNPRISYRKVDKSKFDAEAAIILDILNDAWSANWGFVPITPSEIAFTGKKLKPIVFEDLIMIAEYDGEPVAFIMTLPDVHEMQADLKGNLFPFNFIKLLWRLNGGFSGKPKTRSVRVPLMGVRKRLQSTRMATQLIFTMIEQTRVDAHRLYGADRAEIGWILEDNKGMNSIAEMINAKINKTYRIYEKAI